MLKRPGEKAAAVEQQGGAAGVVRADDASGQQQVVTHRPLRMSAAVQVGDGAGDARWFVVFAIEQRHIREAIMHGRIGEAPGQRFLVCAEDAEREARGVLEHPQALRV